MKKILFTLILFALSMNVLADSDLELFNACFGQEPVEECENADFNKDGVISLLDWGIFRLCELADMDDDGKVKYLNSKDYDSDDDEEEDDD